MKKKRILYKTASSKPRMVRESGEETAIVPQGAGVLPAGYGPFLADLKARIRSAQIRAALASNREMIQLYWDIGKGIAERQKTDGWGRAVVERLAQDLQLEFPGVGGFSQQNLWYMRRFYLAWTEEVIILQRLVGEMVNGKVAQAARQTGDAILSQPVAELPQNPAGKPEDPIVARLVRQLDGQNLPEVVAELPWGQNITLFEKLSAPVKRLWYAHKTMECGWSRDILILQIESDLFHRQGKAITNFPATLPPPQSDLAQQTLKDPYVFDFLMLTDPAREREVEDQLVGHVAAEYALRDIRKPIGVAEWQTKLVRRLPSDLRPSLPTVKEIESALAPLTRDPGAKA